ncbi:HAD-IC family P-type ATPase, partial [Patescibacteria group bacterium]|nr:HAD-IC family P-type ATPase [Patescibacteria group bacterium]
LVTLFLQEWTDAVVIFLAVGLNTSLGFFQEFKAEKALTALRKILVSHVRVVRDGKEVRVELGQLVPGDLVILGTGDKIPADGRLLEGVELHTDEALLTGESVPVVKKEGDEVYMGSMVVTGRGQLLVEKTGLKTKMGKIAAQISQTVEEATPLKLQIGHFSKTLAIIFSLICILILLEGLWRGRPFLEMFTLSVAVAVAAIPEGLVISLTVIMTLGMQRILKRKGLVRRLLAAETLGAVDVICADKTGTLTEGKMRVVETAVNRDSQEAEGRLWRAMVLCNNLINPLELSMMEWARGKVGESIEVMVASHRRLSEVPFNSTRKFISVLTESKENGTELFFSGAPEVVMGMAKLNAKQRKQWQETLDGFARQGLRVVAFSHRQGSKSELQETMGRLRKIKGAKEAMEGGDYQLKWLGLVLFEDPVRVEAKESLRQCRQAGIKVKVITGDYRNTAVAILNKLEVTGGELKDHEIIEGWELAKLSDEQLKEKIEEVALFARTTPQQKIRIVQTLQENGHSVAMMGDGVNDALALKKADIGVVVGGASEVAKETADMVLLDSNFQTIVAAVEEGRGIFENIRKVILYLLSDSFTEVILISGSLLLDLPLPLLPAQILWVNLVEDGLPGLALAFEPKDTGLMADKPRSRKAKVLDKELKAIIFIIGIITDITLLVSFCVLYYRGLPMETVRTVIFAGLAINSLLYVFSCKTLRKNLWHENLLSNWYLIGAVAVGFALLFLGIYLPFLNGGLKTVPLALWWWGLIFGLGLLNTAGIEFVKWLFLRRH